MTGEFPEIPTRLAGEGFRFPMSPWQGRIGALTIAIAP